MALQLPMPQNRSLTVGPAATSGAPPGPRSPSGLSIFTDLSRSARSHQWLKNLFVLAPLLFGRRLGDPRAIGQACLACFCFCLLSSALYILNDILDARVDRAHPEKRHRPIAAGTLPVKTALLAACLLLGLGFALLSLTGWKSLLFAIIYFAITLAYCFGLKRAVILDAMMIAGGFVLRVLSGAAAVEVEPSHWLIVCAFLLALYLAFAKRRQELMLLNGSAVEHRHVLARYSVPYLDQVTTLVACAAIICYALYTVAPDTVARFNTEQLIYGTVFVVYGVLRYMALTQTPVNGGDPSRVLVRDKPLLLAAVAWAVYNAFIIYKAPLLGL
jgi:4-hydroxybenzoate polyprenyltransferase